MSIIDQQVQFIKQKLAENPGAVLALATYTAEEFAELRKGEDYNEFKRGEREFAEALCRAGVPAHNIAFVEIDSSGYYRFIAERKMELGEASRSAYAAYLLNRGVSK
jgi:hypothetical protein